MKDSALADILEELSAREPIFHRREFGTSRQDLDRMMDANFLGNKRKRESLSAKCCQRYRSGAEPHDWPRRNFTLTVLAEGLFCSLTFLTSQDESPDVQRSGAGHTPVGR
jgi:hypothetical protein